MPWGEGRARRVVGERVGDRRRDPEPHLFPSLFRGDEVQLMATNSQGHFDP